MSDVDLRTETEYEAALAQIDRLLDEEPEKGTAAHDELDRLNQMVSTYEVERARAGAPDDLPAQEEPDESPEGV